jgi:SAM-dependent methyltransferase
MLNWAIRYAPIVNFVKKHSGSVLEIGSGSHGVAFYLPDVPIVGTDIEFISPIQKNLCPVIASVDNLPFTNNSFDLVISSDMLEHIAEDFRSRAVQEILRVARKYVIIGFPSGDIAERTDRQIYASLKQLKIAAPPWLLEHFNNPYPTSASVMKALPQEGLSTKVLANGNCVLHKVIIIGEMKPRIFRFFSRFDRINLIQMLSPLLNVGRTYREILLIEKT